MLYSRDDKQIQTMLIYQGIQHETSVKPLSTTYQSKDCNVATRIEWLEKNCHGKNAPEGSLSLGPKTGQIHGTYRQKTDKFDKVNTHAVRSTI